MSYTYESPECGFKIDFPAEPQVEAFDGTDTRISYEIDDVFFQITALKLSPNTTEINHGDLSLAYAVRSISEDKKRWGKKWKLAWAADTNEDSRVAARFKSGRANLEVDALHDDKFLYLIVVVDWKGILDRSERGVSGTSNVFYDFISSFNFIS